MALAEHSWGMGHEIRFSETEKLFQYSCWRQHVVRESLEISLTSGALNWEEGLRLSLA